MASRIAGVKLLQLVRIASHEAAILKPSTSPSFTFLQNPRLVIPANQFVLRPYATENGEQATENESTGADSTESRDTTKDRRKVIPVEVSMSYLNSQAYETTYGQDPVWKLYRRNFKGPFPPKTRKTCIRQGKVSTGSPCPICRDEYLVLDYRNVKLLQQFISPYNGEILSYMKTGLCQRRHQELLIAIEKAKDHGYIPFDIPFKEYDYSEYQHYAK